MDLSGTCPAPNLGVVSQMFTMLIQGLMVSQCSLQVPWPRDYGPFAVQYGLPEYDFIVVGAGSAGSVVANRLSENPNWNVLLLEAGGDPPLESEVPGLAFSMLMTEYDWAYYPLPSNKHSLMMPGIYWPRGKMLGGTSSINGMIYIRGFRHDFDEWAALGNEGWDFETVLEYFKKSENNLAPDLIANTYHHSTRGPMNVDYYRSNTTTLPIVLEGVKQLGYPEIHDLNADQNIGFTFIQGTLAHGRRQSSAKAFLSPIRNRPNLHVIKRAHVYSLDIEGDKVTGVNFNYNNGPNFKARAKKEVILSAGVIGSAQIMMLSGIGPRLELESLGISVEKDLPVGRNLQDHAWVPLFFSFSNTEPPSTQALIVQQFLQYLTNRTGSFAAIPADLSGFINTEDFLSNIPDIQYNHYVFAPQSGDALQNLFRLFGHAPDIINQLLEVNQYSTLLTAAVTIVKPKSIGRLILQSNNPYDKPVLIPNYLDHQDDVNSVVRGLQIYSQLIDTDIFRRYNAKIVRFPLPQCDQYPYDSDFYWECYSRQFTSTEYHPVGTVKMGPHYDPESVVDPTLKVREMDNLRVIDGSIMPRIVSANTNPACIMIGERGADLVKAAWHHEPITRAETIAK